MSLNPQQKRPPSLGPPSAAVIAATDSGPKILSNLIQAQLAEHAPYGGVVPEIAARAHLDYLDSLIVRALAEAGVTLAEIDGIAAAAGPGLIGGLIVATVFTLVIVPVIYTMLRASPPMAEIEIPEVSI